METGGSALALHLRGRQIRGAELFRLAEAARDDARRSGAWLVVNGRADIAAACEANGIQLSASSMRPSDARKVVGAAVAIGVSVHSQVEASEAAKSGADFLLAGTLFSSRSHPSGVPAGPAWLRKLTQFGKPVIGIGGVDATRVPEVMRHGAFGVAVIDAVWSADDPASALLNMLEVIRKQVD
jgi:thiamine-phosphate diphosphorylase